jgi:hypothetical protein
VPRNIMGPITDYGENEADSILNAYLGAWWKGEEYIRFSFERLVKMWEDQRKFVIRRVPPIPATSADLSRMSSESLRDVLRMSHNAHELIEEDMEATRASMKTVREAIRTYERRIEQGEGSKGLASPFQTM